MRGLVRFDMIHPFENVLDCYRHCPPTYRNAPLRSKYGGVHVDSYLGPFISDSSCDIRNLGYAFLELALVIL